MSTFGLTPEGFESMQQQDLITAINTELQQVFGANINLGSESVFGNIVGVFSAQLALVWQLAEAVYNSQYPNGAEGTSVDNILAYNALKRLPASPTVTDAEPLTAGSGITQFGLVFFGTPGTVVSGTVQTTASPPLTFSIDASVTIAASVNAIQTIVFSNVPDSGSFGISITDNNANLLDSQDNVIEYGGNTVPSVLVPFNATADTTSLSFLALPGASSHFGLTLTQTGAALTTGNISTNSAYPTALAIQNAIRALSGYSSVGVSGAAGSYVITWGSISNPVTTVANNTTATTITPVDSFQSSVNNLHDTTSTTNHYPYSDVTVTGTFSGGFALNFGAGSPTTGNSSSGAQPQSLLSVVSNTLFQSATITNTNVIGTQTGAPAQGTGSATCQVNGPNFVAAGALCVIGTPVSGWTGVTNQLDCITGTNVESDTEALERRSALLSAQGNGPLQATVAKVRALSTEPPITSVLGFQNITEAALQVITFSTTPTPASTFTIFVNGTQTGSITLNNNSSDATNVQTAIRALSGYSSVLVTGNTAFGFTIDFNGSVGGQPIPLSLIGSNTTGASISVNFGRPGKSIEVVVQGGAIADIAKAIFASKSGGIETYGTPVVVTGTTHSNLTVDSIASTAGIVVGMLVTGSGISLNTLVSAVGAASVTLSQDATASATVSLSFTYAAIVEDTFGQPYQINFSRPTQVPIYVILSLVTDQYNIPGNAGSGLNTSALFNPASIATIQQDIVTIGNETPIGGRVIGFGTDGLIGAFNAVPGVVSYTLYFATAPSPATNTYIQLLATQLAVFETINCTVSYT